MMTFTERESACERMFEMNGPFWHVYTDGSIMPDIFSCEDDMRDALIALAVCAVLSDKIRIITFELMNNHIHLILAGSYGDSMDFFKIFKRRLKHMFKMAGRVVDWTRFNAQILSIETLKDLRNEIAYVHRNAYVSNRNHTPYTYLWGGGWTFFNPLLDHLRLLSVRELGVRNVRELTHYRDVDTLSSLKFIGDIPFVPSFCRIDIGQSMFHDARSYFQALTRNAEAFSQIASNLKDTIFLTDDEMFVVASRWAQENYSSKLQLLTPDQKMSLAKKLHYEYNASNNQLRRILNLKSELLGEMFPPIIQSSKH
jgi:REP element-mobilizing transposase RayT